MLYALNASFRHLTQYFAISQFKVPHFDLMLSINSGITTSPQNRFLYSCAYTTQFFSSLTPMLKSLIFQLQDNFCEHLENDVNYKNNYT